MPVELAEAIPFAEDTVHADLRPRRRAPASGSRWCRPTACFSAFRGRFRGKASPVHFFWGAFDLAITRFSGRAAPRHPGGVPNCPDWVMREAYSDEVSSCGYWPGGAAEGSSTPTPTRSPQGSPSSRRSRPARPLRRGAGEFVLPYAAVRTAADPEPLLAFLVSTFTAASTTGTWPQIEALVPAPRVVVRVPASRQVRPPRGTSWPRPSRPGGLRIRRFDPSTGREPIMDFATQLENLKKRVDDTVTQVKKAAAEDRTQLEARIDKAQLDADLALKDSQPELRRQRGPGPEQVDTDEGGRSRQGGRRQGQDPPARQGDGLPGCRDRRRGSAESEASAAIDFASWAADNARLAVLDALDARAYASELAKKVAPGAG